MREGVLFCGVLPWVISTVDPNRVGSRYMFSIVPILVLAKQIITIIVPVSDVQETAGSHRIKFRRCLEPAEFRAILISPLPGRIFLLYFSISKGFAIILNCLEFWMAVNLWNLRNKVIVLDFLHHLAQEGSVAILDMLNKLVGKEEGEITVVDRSISAHGGQKTIP